MPGMRDIRKVQRSFGISRVLDAKVLKAFGKEGTSVARTYVKMVRECVQNVVLTKDDYDRIRADIDEAAEKRRNRKGKTT